MKTKQTNYCSPTAIELEIEAEQTFAQSGEQQNAVHDVFMFDEEYIWE